MSQKSRERWFWVFTLIIGLINLKYIHRGDYLMRLLIRIPQVILIFYLYRKFVNNDITEITKIKYQLKGAFHKCMIIVGIAEFIFIAWYSNIHRYGNQQNEQSFNLILKSLTDNLLYTLGIVALSIIACLPILYVITQLTVRLRDITVWFYKNKKIWFVPFLIFEDIAITVLFSAFR